MNRLPAKFSSKQRKRNQKEVKKGAKMSPKALEENEAATREEWKKRHPHKELSPQKRGQLVKNKTLQKPLKKGKKTSKRTGSEEKIEGSTPAHVHSEGSFWQKVLTKQGALQRKLFGRSFLKKK